MIKANSGIPVAEDDQGRDLYRAWISGRLRPGATADLEALLAGSVRQGGPAPLFESGWDPGQDRTLTDATSRNLATLRRGDCDLVITGQQPGRLGGPLYTLYKLATTVELARLMSEAGRPTVPVYWSGDDDDDHDEALAPVCWDPATGGLLDLPSGPGRKSSERRHPMVGRLGCRETATGEASWLQGRVEEGSSLETGLARLWAEAVDSNRTWAGLQTDLIDLLFPDDGVVVVSGDDRRLHATAAPLYERLMAEGDRWSSLVGRSGKDLAASGYHAQITGRAIERGLFADVDGYREEAEPGAESGSLRPGVMFRSPIQDWLLEPAAVVVGPGELAYLKQLEPLYAELGIHRSPLVPRLTAWLLPEDQPEPGWEPVPDPAGAEEWAARATGLAVDELQAILATEIGLDPQRATELAAARGRRFAKGAVAMLRDEAVRARARYREELPGWVHPRGARQERTLALGCALGLWGAPLLEAVRVAAREHLVLGRNNDWRRFRFDVPDPSREEGST